MLQPKIYCMFHFIFMVVIFVLVVRICKKESAESPCDELRD